MTRTLKFTVTKVDMTCHRSGDLPEGVNGQHYRSRGGDCAALCLLIHVQLESMNVTPLGNRVFGAPVRLR